ncbi:MAG TPA: hypothetical protein VJ770_28380 [Stellaceae bacterium]|nr:hypothetical protein [Stellaceae bacterium]
MPIRSPFRRRPILWAALAVFLSLSAAAPAQAFDLFATHEVTAQFATQDGKPMAHAAVRVFAPGNAIQPALSGRTDADGKFTFAADRDGFWSAEAKSAGEVARVMIRVGATAPAQPSRIPPVAVIGVLFVLLVVAFWYRLLRRRSRRPRS